MTKDKNFLFGIGISNLSKQEILEEIKKWLKRGRCFCQIVTVNPEILTAALKNEKFKKVLQQAQISTPDGIGIVLAGKILGVPFKERVTGVELMREMVKIASDLGLTVGLIGGRDNVAVRTAECLKKLSPNFNFFALEGVKNVKKETFEERAKIISIIRASKPQMLFVAFGAPWQELFIDSLKKDLDPTYPVVAIGVGGAFDEISGKVRKVPKWIERIGLKWLFRLIQEPWRAKRQLALLEFVYLVFKEFLRKKRFLVKLQA